MKQYSTKTACKYKLYKKSVQCVEAEIDFVEKVYKNKHKKSLRILKEDFCGTAAAAVEFIKRHKKNKAICVDLEPEVLNWCRKHYLPKLGKRASNLILKQANVLEVQKPQVEVIMAMNFSYFIFKERKQLLEYFRSSLAGLKSDGIFILDAYGGTEAQDEIKEKTEHKNFTYVWEQASYDPVNNGVINHIHFYFPDKTKLKKAFTYDWRLWTLKEITETLLEAGFSNAEVYWEGWDEKNETGNGVFKKVTSAENSAGWVTYIVAEK